MSWTIIIKPSAKRELENLPSQVIARAVRSIFLLEENPYPPGAKKLEGRVEYRIRVGAYRILYLIHKDTKTVEVIAIRHRREVYRRRRS